MQEEAFNVKMGGNAPPMLIEAEKFEEQIK